MNTVDVISGVLLGGAAAAAARGLWRVTIGAPPPNSGRVSRVPELFTAAVILAGAGFYVRVMNDGPPPAVHRTPWSSVVAAGSAVLLAAAAAAGTAWALRARRRPPRRRPQLPVGDGDLAALTVRHDAVRERYGALLTADRSGRLDADSGELAALTQALTAAADAQTGPEGPYAARSAYARAVGELEAAWEPIAAQARRQGIALPDDVS